ncbi:hypothetical protein B5G11_09925 [Drancourtella sp. An57]|uniref:hypothetical protein n=1 Tax=Drancourtella sp. An57 TaxID=1965647 RepID=UPI000B37B53A|nr:hypothetical protein [Drancourtella sp. An57]OUN69334.1 hypothetical protein B5G11_09925 [Drancourtella sp. An57]
MRKGTSLLKTVFLLVLFLVTIQKITGSSDFTSSVLGIFQAIIVTAMPAVIMVAGIYMLIRCLFR